MDIKTFILCLLAVNLMTFLVFGLDKLLAVKHLRRIPEASLLTLSFLTGSIGAMFGMSLFHHKTDGREHPGFVWGIPAIFVTELSAAVYLVLKVL